MTRWVAEFTVPADDRDGTTGVKFEDGGQAAVMYAPAGEMRVVEGDDGCFFVRLQSWADGPLPNTAAAHPIFRALMGKKVRVTIETDDA